MAATNLRPPLSSRAHQTLSSLLCSVWVLRTTLRIPENSLFLTQTGVFLKVLGKHLIWTKESLDALILLSPEDEKLKLAIADLEPQLAWERLLTKHLDFLEHALPSFSAVQPKLMKQVLQVTFKSVAKRLQTKRDPIRENICYLQQVFGLTDTEREILFFAAHLSCNANIRAFSRGLSGVSYLNTISYLAALIDATDLDVMQATQERGRLVSLQLMKVKRSSRSLEEALLVSDHICECLIERNQTMEGFISRFITPVNSSELAPSAFSHLESDAIPISNLLAGLRQRSAQGINILIYGATGTGKTEFVKSLAAQIGAVLYEVAYTGSSGIPLERLDRLASFQMSQHVLASRPNSLLLFDEVEDIFQSAQQERSISSSKKSFNLLGKAWMNNLLETNQVPVIWVTNSIKDIDPAFLRRFVYHMEISTPPLQARHQIAQHHLQGTEVSEQFIKRLATAPNLSPALLENVARVVYLSGATESAAEQLAMKVIQNSHQVLKPNEGNIPEATVTTYDLNYLNIESRYSITQIIEALGRRPSASLCFYGLPGTGKTALAIHMAESLGLPLLVKRASDILSKWVGESERNIASMFREATKQKAILFLDEADGLLSNRDGAEHRWEINQVNELLQQMERFEGILICATNLFDHFDTAALRRFSFKIAFKAMTLEQRIAMFTQEALGGQSELFLPAYQERLSRLSTLVPGDFAVVMRQVRLMQVLPSPEDFLAELEQECKLKPGGHSGIGFLAINLGETA